MKALQNIYYEIDDEFNEVKKWMENRTFKRDPSEYKTGEVLESSCRGFFNGTEIVVARGGSICHRCLQPIRKNEIVITGFHDFGGCGSWTTQPVQCHFNDCSNGEIRERIKHIRYLNNRELEIGTLVYYKNESFELTRVATLNWNERYTGNTKTYMFEKNWVAIRSERVFWNYLLNRYETKKEPKSLDDFDRIPN